MSRVCILENRIVRTGKCSAVCLVYIALLHVEGTCGSTYISMSTLQATGAHMGKFEDICWRLSC